MAAREDLEQEAQDYADSQSVRNSKTISDYAKDVLTAVYGMTPLPEYFKWYNDPNYSTYDALYDLQDKYVPFNSAYQNWRLDKDQDWERNIIDGLLLAYPAGKGIVKGTKSMNAAYEAANPGRNAKSGLIAFPKAEEFAKLTPEEQAKVQQAVRDINVMRQRNGLMATPQHFERQELTNFEGQNLENMKNAKRAAEFMADQVKLSPKLSGVRTNAIGLGDATDAAVVRHGFSNYNAVNDAFNKQILHWIKSGKIPGYSVKKVNLNNNNFAYHIYRDADGALVNPHDEFKALYNAQMEKWFPGYTKASETPNKRRF